VADVPKTTVAPPAVSAQDAMRYLDVMIGCMTMWDEASGTQAELMRGWRRWLECIRPFVAEAAERSNQP
jgi:hypothetical protein